MDTVVGTNVETNEEIKKAKKKRRWLWLLIPVLILVLIAAAGLLYYNNLLNQLSFDWKEPQGTGTSSAGSLSGGDASGTGLKDKVEAAVSGSKNVINVLLIGSDERLQFTSDPGRADVTMLCSLNRKTGDVKLISFERGIMVEIPGEGTDLLTHSFHYGGAELTTNIIREYFGLDIAGYAHVDFDSFRQLVDTVGGVDIELSAAEAWGIGAKSEGMNHLDGDLALKYCRLRKIDSNWNRIARQRTMIQALMNRFKGMSLGEISDLAEEILPLVHTSLTKGEITSILLRAPKFLGASVEQMAVPDNNDQNCDFEYETQRIHEFIYD